MRGNTIQVIADKAIKPTENPVRMELEEHGVVYLKKKGEKNGRLVASGTSIKIRLENFECELYSTANGVMNYRPERLVEPKGEIFTNLEKRPTESAAEQAVTLALRRFNQSMKMKQAEAARENKRLLEERELIAKKPPEGVEGDPEERKKAKAEAEAKAKAEAEAKAKAEEVIEE